MIFFSRCPSLFHPRIIRNYYSITESSIILNYQKYEFLSHVMISIRKLTVEGKTGFDGVSFMSYYIPGQLQMPLLLMVNSHFCIMDNRPWIL